MTGATPPPATASMIAAISDGRGGLVAAAVTRPRPAAGEVLLRVRRAGLCGTDLWKLRQGSAMAGLVLGHEVVATVEAVGAGVSHLAPGERMVAVHHVACGACALCRQDSETQCAAYRVNQLSPGGFAEQLVVRPPGVEAGLFRLPPGLADDAAVFLEPAACVVRGIRRGRRALGAPQPPPGESAGRQVVVVLGAGSMGLLHLLVLRALASPAPTEPTEMEATDDPSAPPPPIVIVADPLAERRALALRLGADAAPPPGARLRQAVLDASAGRGADLVFDTVGGAALLDEALAVGRPGGAVVLFAHAPGAAGEPAGFALNSFFKSERQLVATYSSGLADQRAALALLASGRLDPRPLVSHRLPLSRVAEAVELATSHRALKVLLGGDER